MELQKPQVGDVWYRYDDKKYASVDPETDRVYVSPVRIEESVYVVTKVTPKGVWVQRCFGDPKKFDPKTMLSSSRSFVLQGEGKRMAHPSKELALESLLARKSRQASIYSARLKDAESAKRLAQHELSKLKPVPEPASKSTEDLLFA